MQEKCIVKSIHEVKKLMVSFQETDIVVSMLLKKNVMLRFIQDIVDIQILWYSEIVLESF